MRAVRAACHCRGYERACPRDWRTYRMSDHLPMWIESGIDDSDSYLEGLIP